MRTLWWIFRFLVLAAGLSLAAYIPYKYATQLHAISGIYAFLFPFSSLVAVAGILLAVRPQFSFSLPIWLRSAVSVISIGWIATGVICVPSLSKTVIAAPLKGLFAAFHMTAQHLFLSLSVVFLLLAPQIVFSFFRQPTPSPEKATKPAPGEI